MKKLLIICLLPIFTACYQGEAIEEPIETPIRITKETETIDVEKLKESCVILYVKKYTDNVTYSTHGSGVLIDYDKVLTVYHAVDDFTEFAINYNDSDKDYFCTLIKIKPKVDLAILKTPKENIQPVKIGNSDNIKSGDKIYVISSPQGEKNVVTTGKVISRYGENLIISSAKIEPGSSGGGVFNIKGELIGIMARQIKKKNESYFIPINKLK